jgi:hypothetical protein
MSSSKWHSRGLYHFTSFSRSFFPPSPQAYALRDICYTGWFFWLTRLNTPVEDC